MEIVIFCLHNSVMQLGKVVEKILIGEGMPLRKDKIIKIAK